ncbi:MAG: hypothetical protein MZV70_20310 [Desulfobacterales bacterium]|nr:hypothetical protein [Desulfobacterales bacterium]
MAQPASAYTPRCRPGLDRAGGPSGRRASVTLLHLAPGRGQRPVRPLKIGDDRKNRPEARRSTAMRDYVTAPVTGAVAALAPFAGELRPRRAPPCTITAASWKTIDDAVRGRPPGRRPRKPLRSFLAAAPGRPALERLGDPQRPLKTLVVCGVDEDLLVVTQQHVLARPVP